VTRNRRPPWSCKRLTDLALVLGTAPFWLPLLGMVALLVRLKLGAPVLFRQRRPGLQGGTFELIKFRSMTDARDSAARLLADDQRLSPFGAWLRSTSLDELPELFNVLKGDMSLVGPRPLLVQYLDRYSPEQARRHEVPPGLTGPDPWPERDHLGAAAAPRCVVRGPPISLARLANPGQDHLAGAVPPRHQRPGRGHYV